MGGLLADTCCRAAYGELAGRGAGAKGDAAPGQVAMLGMLQYQ